MGAFSKPKIKKAVWEYAPLMLGLYVPGFIKIHWRYARRSPVTWVVLFLAPFIIGMMILSVICRRWLEVSPSGWQLFLITLFLIAIAFFFAERHRAFRRIYVMAVPGMVVLNGLFKFIIPNGISLGSLITFGILAGFPAWVLGRHSMGKGYKLLSNGADKDYRPGHDLYMEGKYKEAFVYLEPSAKRGHMKSLYLLGHAHEHGNGCESDRITAARFYDKAGRKGYRKAHHAFETLFVTFTAEEIDAFENDLGISGINELF